MFMQTDYTFVPKYEFNVIHFNSYNKTSCFEWIKFITEDTKVKHTQTLQLFTMIIKIESVYKSN